jgi:hypothetical protein
MTTTVWTKEYRKARRPVPEFALVLGFALGGLILSLVLAGATWPDMPFVGP